MEIAGRRIGAGARCFVIAEAGVNHDGDPDVALQLVDVAAAAGADAVKFQTFRADLLATPDAPKAEYQERTDPAASQLDMLQRLELRPAQHLPLIDRCRERGIVFLSTPFEEASADLLEQLNLSAFKIPSCELTNLPFLTHVARKGRPMIVSTGMATIDEVRQAVAAIAAAGDPPVALLHCVSNYPADAADTNLRAMQTLAREFGCPVGYSDHTMGIDVALAAATLGASIIEKHFTLDRRREGPDHEASLEPDELRSMTCGIRRIESALGTGEKAPAASEVAVAAVVRKSLTAAVPIAHGTVITEDMLIARRPGTGLPPSAGSLVVGRRTRVDIPATALISVEMLQ